MALPSTATQTDHESATQETMFEDSNDFAGLEAYEAAEESSYEPAEGFSGDALESASATSDAGSSHGATASTNEDLPEVAGEFTDAVAQPDSPPTNASGLASGPASEPAVATEPETMTVLTVDDFAALEERILRAVSLVRSERQARVAAEERTAALEVEVQAQIPAIDRLQQEVDSLRAERDQVRQRIERLLSQLDAMDM
jgi:FtsZ-binding cell division protein ZapB